MKTVLIILVIVLFIKGATYKAAFFIMADFIKEKKHIIPTDEELKECANYVAKHDWIKVLF